MTNIPLQIAITSAKEKARDNERILRNHVHRTNKDIIAMSKTDAELMAGSFVILDTTLVAAEREIARLNKLVETMNRLAQ